MTNTTSGFIYTQPQDDHYSEHIEDMKQMLLSSLKFNENKKEINLSSISYEVVHTNLTTKHDAWGDLFYIVATDQDETTAIRTDVIMSYELV